MRIFKKSKEKVTMEQYIFRFQAVKTMKHKQDDPDYLLFLNDDSNKECVVGSMKKSGPYTFEISLNLKAQFDVVSLQLIREVKDEFGKDYIEEEDGTLTEIPKFREI
ncbi:MAG: hypothetical protein IBX72_11410 [Nitrospirae bacterium]|nr:hypothetical protein [Nitrospirota bacterium]